MRYLYYCNSTYQLLNILNLNWHRKNANFENITDYSADLYLLNSFDGADRIAELIKNNNYFNKVVLLEKTFNSGKLHGFKTVLDLLSPSFYMKDKHNIKKDEIYNRYDVITSPKYSAVVDFIWKLNKKARLDLYEDGTASYDLVITLKSNSDKINKMRKLLSYNDFYDYSHLYLVSKSLYTGKNPERVVEIPKYDKDYLNEIKKAFSSFNSYDTDKNIFWLSQFLNNKEFNEMVDDVIHSLVDYKDEVLFVQHPRKHLENKYGFDETDGKQIWELQMLNVKDFNNKLLISIHSTASYTAKMLYDFEPYIILFYKLGDNEVTAVNEDFEEFLRRFKQSYRNPEKIMIPETIDEFKKCIKRYYKLTNEHKE